MSEALPPRRLGKEDRAAMWLHEWRGRHCERSCGKECRLPSVGKTQLYCAVGHGTAQRARQRTTDGSEKCRRLETVPENGTVSDGNPCAEQGDVQ